jgi:hypothetical protein
MSDNPPNWEPPHDPDNITGKYILKHRKPVECFDLLKWDKWLGRPYAKRVRSTHTGDAWISTVFLGINHDFRVGKDLDRANPLIFETMVFFKDEKSHGPIENYEMERCRTWRQALEMHWAMVEWVKHEQSK